MIDMLGAIRAIYPIQLSASYTYESLPLDIRKAVARDYRRFGKNATTIADKFGIPKSWVYKLKDEYDYYLTRIVD